MVHAVNAGRSRLTLGNRPATLPTTIVLSGEGIVCISSIDWDANWQAHQEVMSALAASGNDVLFIENTGVRLPTRRDMPRLYRRIANARRAEHGLRPERDRLFVHSPILVPLP